MSEAVKYPKIGGHYVHYKGGEYEVVTMAKHTETDEPLVVYKSITWGGGHYARPLNVWNEDVDGEPRFKLKKNEDEDENKGIGFKTKKDD